MFCMYIMQPNPTLEFISVWSQKVVREPSRTQVSQLCVFSGAAESRVSVLCTFCGLCLAPVESTVLSLLRQKRHHVLVLNYPQEGRSLAWSPSLRKGATALCFWSCENWVRGEDLHILKIWIKSLHQEDEAFIQIFLNLKKDPTSKFRRMFGETNWFLFNQYGLSLYYQYIC